METTGCSVKQYIVIDFDDVIAETMLEGFLVNLNTQCGQRITWTLEHFHEFSAANVTGLDEDTIKRLFAEIDFGHVGAVEDAVANIRDLIRQGHSVQIVTANPDDIGIRSWLDRYGLKDVPLTCTSQKIAFMERRGFNVIIDDNPSTLRKAASCGYQAIRFERPWNKNLSSPKGDGTILTFEWGSWSNEHTAPTWNGVFSVIQSLAKGDFIPCDREFLPGKRWKYSTLESKHLPFYDEIRKGVEEHYHDEKLDTAMKAARPFSDTIANEKGALQTDLKARFDLLPALAIARVAQVLHTGEQKYGKDNWRGLTVAECHNHTIGHAIGFNNSDDIDDLAHTACRALMTLELALTKWVRDG